MRHSLLALLATGAGLGCGTESVVTPPPPPPPPNVAIVVAPSLSGTFSGQPGSHQLTATITDTLGNPLPALTPSWSVLPATGGATVSATGLATVAPTALVLDHTIRATVAGVIGTAVVRVLPRPLGKLYFTAGSTEHQLWVKDFSNDQDAVQLTSGSGGMAGFDVDPVRGIIVLSRPTGSADLFRMNLDGTGLVSLTNDGGFNQAPVIHPLTGEIYFSRRPPGTTSTQIWKMAADGTGITQISTGSQVKAVPAISPDGQRLAWTEFYPSFNTEIVTAGVQGNDPVRLTDRVGSDANAFWLTNSRVVWNALVGGNFDLFVSDIPPAGAPVNLTVVSATDNAPSPGCSPNTLTFLSTRSGTGAQAFQLDLASGLVVKYTLPTERSMVSARRICQ